MKLTIDNYFEDWLMEYEDHEAEKIKNKIANFTKKHVENALKEAGKIGYKMGHKAIETEQEILNSYPLENIK